MRFPDDAGRSALETIIVVEFPFSLNRVIGGTILFGSGAFFRPGCSRPIRRYLQIRGR
jgi:hypothetical protein